MPSLETLLFVLVSAAALLWITVSVLPWRPWSSNPHFDAESSEEGFSLQEVTALIPARNEAHQIRQSLHSLALQGSNLRIVVVDDQSEDDTAGIAKETLRQNLLVVSGKPLPRGWSGKLWALEQGRHHIETPFTLLMDADIELSPGIVVSALHKMKDEKLHFLSLMAAPPLCSFWERLLMPAFVYFFKQLYPFDLSNSRFPGIAAAAGGFVMLETRVLDEIGGFAVIRSTLIDDCALARRVKEKGNRIWMGLTHSVRSVRAYKGLTEIWNMVERTAFTQLNYSIAYLLICTALMLIGFVVPIVTLLWQPWGTANALALITSSVMSMNYVPTLRFYHCTPAWVLGLPAVGVLFLLMTWSSAFRYWHGQQAQWRGRAYSSG